MIEFKFRLLLSLTLCFVALPSAAPASPSTALKRYEKGRFESALLEYKRLLMEKPDDSRLHFNAGTAAFQVHDYEEAGKQLNAALAAQDLQLQERAYYNLGNTEYRLGATAPSLEKKQTHWEQAISSYESALKLNAQDEDAKFNLKLVKQKLVELGKARAEADEAVRQRNYTKALGILSEFLRQNPNEEDAKYAKRLEDIIKIQSANQH